MMKGETGMVITTEESHLKRGELLGEEGTWFHIFTERTGKREGNFKILSQGATKQQKGRKEIAKKGARETSDNKSNIIGKLEVLKRIYKRYTSQHT